MDTILSLIPLVSETLKIPRARAEAHFLKKLAFVTNKCLAQDAFGIIQEQQKTFQNTQHYVNKYVHRFSYFPYILQRYPSK